MITSILRILRIHQWAKNLLVFVPLLGAHRVGEQPLLFDSILAFFSLSLLASSLYVINDYLDIESDRIHPRKRMRPFVSGALSPRAAWILFPFLASVSILFALFLPVAFLIILGAYALSAFAYSLQLKKIVILDVLILAGLYTLRIFAGGIACGIPVSEWLMAFSLFFFLSLAFLKRYTELASLAHTPDAERTLWRRGYRLGDFSLLSMLGAASGYLAVLVLALYITGDRVMTLYRHPQGLWLLCPLLLYWISRAWLMAQRGIMEDDPIVFAFGDLPTYFVGIAALAIIYFSS